MKNTNFLMLKHSQLEGERIRLRPMTIDDAQDLYEFTSDEETTRFIYEPHTDLSQAENVIGNYYLKEPIEKYAVALKDSDKLIGIVEFRAHSHNHNGELGYTLNRQYWGKGYMTEAC